MPNSVNDSRFNMWRAVVAMVHADGVVTPHELDFINQYMAALSLTSEQSAQIADDLKQPQDVFKMFALVTAPEDQRDFFSLARALSWSDGDFDAQEEKIIKQLELKADDYHDLLVESRETIEELELNGSRWGPETAGRKSLFGLLDFLKAA